MSVERGFEFVVPGSPPPGANPPPQPPGTPPAAAPPRYFGFISRNPDNTYTPRIHRGDALGMLRPQVGPRFSGPEEARSWLQKEGPRGREMAEIPLPKTPDRAPPPLEKREAKPEAPHRAEQVPKPHRKSPAPPGEKAPDRQAAPQPGARAREAVETAPPAPRKNPDSLLDDANPITTFGELADFLHRKLERDVGRWKEDLGRDVEAGTDPLLATFFATGLGAFEIIFKGATGWMRLGADAGEGGKWAPLKEAGNLLSVPGLGGVLAEGIIAGGASLGRFTLTQAERGVAYAGGMVDDLAKGMNNFGPPRFGPQLAAETGYADDLYRQAGRIDEQIEQGSRAVSLRTGGSGQAASGTWESLTTRQQAIIRRIEDALQGTGSWHYEGLKRMLSDGSRRAMDAHHLALASLFRRGPPQFRFLEKWVPSVPLTEVEHVLAHQGVTISDDVYGGLNYALREADLYTGALGNAQLFRGVEECALYYERLGAIEYAEVLRSFLQIVKTI